jgi:hypothetical protein
MRRVLPFLQRVPPIPWLLLTLVVAGLGLALALGFLDNQTCGSTYLIALVGFCMARGSVWLPMLAFAPFLRLPQRRGAQIALFASLFLGVGVLVSSSHSYTYTSAYGGSWEAMALEMIWFGAAYSFWFTVATAAVAFGTSKLSQRRA